MNIFEQQQRINNEAEIFSKLTPEMKKGYLDFKQKRQEGLQLEIPGPKRKLKSPVIIEFVYGDQEREFYVDEVTQVSTKMSVTKVRQHMLDIIKQMEGVSGPAPDFVIHGPEKLSGSLIDTINLIWQVAYWTNFYHYPQITRDMVKEEYATLLEGKVAAVKFNMMTNEVFVATDMSQVKQKAA